MGNFSININLTRLKGSFLTDLKGKTATKRCLIIPVEEAGMYAGEKGVYLNMTAIEMRRPMYGDTHCVRISLDKEAYDALSEEERKSVPILGGMRVLEPQARATAATRTVDAAAVFENPEDDLPF